MSTHTTTAPPRQRPDGATLTPINTCRGGVICTLNTRYDLMSMSDIITLKHYPKTVILIQYDQR